MCLFLLFINNYDITFLGGSRSFRSVGRTLRILRCKITTFFRHTQEKNAQCKLKVHFCGVFRRVLFPGEREIVRFIGSFDAVAHASRVAEKGFGGVEALAGDFGNGAVEVHLPLNLVAGSPRGRI